MSLPNVLSFSGGQTSGYMLWREIQRLGIEEYKRTFTTIFCNTGKEHDKTLDFVHEVETQWGVPVVWLEYTRIPAADIDPLLVPKGRKRSNLVKAQESGLGAHWFKTVDYASAKRIGQHGPFDEMLEWIKALPNVRGRSCSAFLKQRTIQKYLRSKPTGEYNCYIGIRADEAHRALEIKANCDDRDERPMFPLVDGRVDKQEVDAFWGAHPFRLNIPNHMGNCDLCFLKARWKRIMAARDNPQGAQWWADWESKKAETATGDGARFIKGQSYADLIEFAQKLPAGELTLPKPKQKSPWVQSEMNLSEQDIPCSCAVGGYRGGDDDEV